MRPSFHPRLINDPLSDPGLFIPFLFEKRALMFDLGDLHALSPRDLLKVTHGFVTHTHMDHFIGFDTLLRHFLGREKELHLFGPAGFFKQVEGKLAGYTWNLVSGYQYNFVLKVTEVLQDRTFTKTYVCREHFKPKGLTRETPFTGILLKEPSFYVEGVLLDHSIPCLGFSLVENFYVNIIKEGLRALDLPIGPWLTRFKKAIYEKRDFKMDFSVTWEERGAVIKERRFKLGDLAQKIARISPGQKITYVADVIGSPENREKICHLAQNSDHLFIEAAFLDDDKDTAREKYHLTAKEAGELAKKAGARRFILFHFSPRYSDRAEEIEKEAMEGFL